MRTQNPKLPPPTSEQISGQLQRMLASPDCHASPQQIAILKLIVKRTLAGKARKLDDSTVACGSIASGRKTMREPTGKH